MQRLLQGMGESVASKQLKQKADVKKSGAIGNGSKKHELPDEEIVVKEEEGESVFLDDVTNLVNYLKKIDNENPNIEAFTQLALFVVMNGSVTIVDKNAKPHAIDKWSALRKLLKGQVYRVARLKPRLSDVDFGVNEVADSALLRDVPRQVSEEEIMSMLREYLPIASELQKYIEKNSLVMPLASHVAVSDATSNVMMKMMPMMAEQHTSPLVASLVAMAAEEPMCFLLATYEKMLVDTCNSVEKLTHIPTEFTCYDNFKQLGLSAKVVTALRLQVCLHVMSLFGNFKYNHKSEGAVEKTDVIEQSLGMPVIQAALASMGGSSFLKGDFGSLGQALVQAPIELPTFFDRMFGIVEETKANAPAAVTTPPLMQEAAMKEKLGKLDFKGLVEFAAAEGLHIDISKAVDVFPVEKNKVVEAIAAKKLEQMPEYVLANAVFADGPGKLAYVVGKYHEKYLATPKTRAPLSGDEEAATSQQGHDGGPSTLTVEDWLAMVISEEKASQPEDESFTKLQREQIVAAVQFKHFLRSSGNPMSTQGRNVDKLLVEHNTAAGKQFFRIKQSGVGAASLLLWGKIVEGSAASTVPRQYLLPLGISHGVALFLDGSRTTNFHATDLCLGWLVGQRSAPTTTAVCSAPPPRKKQKKKRETDHSRDRLRRLRSAGDDRWQELHLRLQEALPRPMFGLS